MRLPLVDGQWAEMRERLTYGQAQPLRAAMGAAKQDFGTADQLTDAFLRAYVSSWNVLDLDGNAVPLDQPDLAPDDVVQAIVLKAAELWKGMKMPVPKAGTARLRSMPKAQRSG